MPNTAHILIVKLLLFVAVFMHGAPQIASANPDLLLNRSLLDVTVESRRAVRVLNTLTRDEALQVLNGEYDKYFYLEATDFDLHEVQKRGKKIIETLFEARIELRDRVFEVTGGQVDIELINAGKRVMRAYRNVEDLVGEAMIHFATVDEKEIKTVFLDGSPWTLVNPRVGTRKVYSGDIFISRGKVPSSAAIARIGDEDYQFSHMGFFHFNEEDDKWYIPEALIEKGLVNNDVSHALHGPARLAVYRLRSSAMSQYPELQMTSGELAQQAAKVVFERAKETKDKGEILPYNFSMTLEPYNQLFCTQAVRYGFDMASHGVIKLPTVLSKLSDRNRDFLGKIGVTASETFAPGDIEFDPRFEMVAEWRDYRFTPKIRTLDLTLTSIFRWMEEEGWKFESTWYIDAAVHFAKYLTESRFEWIRNLPSRFGAEIPFYMTPEVMATMIMLHTTAMKLYEEADKFSKKTLKLTGYPATPKEIYDFLENYKTLHPRGIKYLRPSE